MNTSATTDNHKNGNSDAPHAGSPIDYFLHPSFYGDSSLLFRVRVLIASQHAIIIVSVLTIFFLVLAPVPQVSLQVGVPVCGIFIAILVPLLAKLKRDGSFAFCGRATVWMIFVPTGLGTFITGGMTESPVAHLLMGPPLLMAFFFGGIRFGIVVALVEGLVVFVGLIAERSGLPTVQTFTAEQLDVVSSALVINGIFCNALLAFLYEYVSGTVRKARDKEHQRVIRLAQTDALTGLANRRIFDETLADRIARYHSGHQQREFALCYLDLNGFKPINDRHGHDVGDQVLRAISIRLRSSLRGADLIGRQGGDEFMLILGDLQPGPQLEILANRFLQIMAEPIETSAGLLSVTGSLGFAFFPAHGSDTEALKISADAAMYEAKRGHFGWRIYGIDPTTDSL